MTTPAPAPGRSKSDAVGATPGPDPHSPTAAVAVLDDDGHLKMLAEPRPTAYRASRASVNTTSPAGCLTIEGRPMPMPRMVWPRGRGAPSTGGSGRSASRNALAVIAAVSCVRSARRPRDYYGTVELALAGLDADDRMRRAVERCVPGDGPDIGLVKPRYATKFSAIRSSITRITVGMLMFSRSTRLDGEMTPSVRIKSTTAERLSRQKGRRRGWRFILNQL
jgi:hypothetical protein